MPPRRCIFVSNSQEEKQPRSPSTATGVRSQDTQLEGWCDYDGNDQGRRQASCPPSPSWQLHRALGTVGIGQRPVAEDWAADGRQLAEAGAGLLSTKHNPTLSLFSDSTIRDSEAQLQHPRHHPTMHRKPLCTSIGAAESDSPGGPAPKSQLFTYTSKANKCSSRQTSCLVSISKQTRRVSFALDSWRIPSDVVVCTKTPLGTRDSTKTRIHLQNGGRLQPGSAPRLHKLPPLDD